MPIKRFDAFMKKSFFQIKDKLDCVESKQSVKRRLLNNILRNKMSQVTRDFLKDNDRLLRKLELENKISNFNRRLKLNSIFKVASFKYRLLKSIKYKYKKLSFLN